MSTRSPFTTHSHRRALRGSGLWARARGWIVKLFRRPARAVPDRAAGKRVSVLMRDDLATVRRDLSLVLDQHVEARKVMRYVRALEQGLHQQGRHALDLLPTHVIRRALEQLDSFVTDWSPEGLTTLRSKAALAVANRELVAEQRAESHLLSRYQEVEVEEASVTAFMAANEEWERSFPGHTDPVPLNPAEVATSEAARPR